MYNLNTVLEITKDDVLKHTTEFNIFCELLGYQPIINKVYNSPLRQDPRPSFGIFVSRTGKLMFKDLGTGECGDCFRLASLLTGNSVNKVIRAMYEKTLTVQIKHYIPIINSTVTEIVTEPIPFTTEALAYWENYGITLSTLNKFKVGEIKKFWVNGQARGWKSKTNLLFSYLIFDKYKIYKPLDPLHRFITNCSISEIQGWEQLDYTKDTVIITKSLKDIMLLHELEYTAIAPGGEGQTLPKEALRILRKHFKYIIVLYDKDKPGMINARKMVKNNPDFGFMFTPSKREKDISDFYLSNGKDKTIELLAKKINYVKITQYAKSNKTGFSTNDSI